MLLKTAQGSKIQDGWNLFFMVSVNATFNSMW